MKIMPMLSSGIVLMHEDGTFEMAPLQVFRVQNGQTVIRIGNNTLWFGENGEFDGSECRGAEGTSPETLEALKQAFELQGANKGKAPASAYFQDGSPGWQRETAAWPKPVTH